MGNSAVTVVGAGMAGLSAALLAARAGFRVELVEGSRGLGGLAGSHRFRGVACDMGSHRLHPSSISGAIFSELGAKCGFETRPRRGVVRIGRRWVTYPPSPLGLMRGLGAARAGGFALSLAEGRLWHRWEADRMQVGSDDVGFERFVRRRAGDAAYETFYEPYARKVWGIEPDELSQTVAKSRVSTSTPVAALARLLSEPRLEFVYPQNGIGSMVGYLAAQLEEAGVEIRLGERWEPSTRDGGRAVLYSGGFLSRDFEHRGLYLLYVAVPVQRLRHFETYYTPGEELFFGRVAELMNYSPRLSRPGETILVVEIPEGAWGTEQRFDQGALWKRIVSQLHDAEILPPDLEPIDVEQRFLPSVYPMYRRGWVEQWRTAMRETAQLGNVYPFGRQGLFLHCNLHHCAQMAEDVVRHVADRGNATAWAKHAEQYLGMRVAD